MTPTIAACGVGCEEERCGGCDDGFDVAYMPLVSQESMTDGGDQLAGLQIS